MDRDAAIAKLKAHEAELKRLGVKSLYLFGSTARGDASDNSDRGVRRPSFLVTAHTPIPRLDDIVEAIERVREVVDAMPLEAFESDWQSKWPVERGIEIISEANRHLPPELKARHPDIPWRQVAGIGNVLRHNYENVAAPVIWSLVRNDLPRLEQVCRHELAAARASD